jgi:hypothetical protein
VWIYIELKVYMHELWKIVGWQMSMWGVGGVVGTVALMRAELYRSGGRGLSDKMAIQSIEKDTSSSII